MTQFSDCFIQRKKIEDCGVECVASEVVQNEHERTCYIWPTWKYSMRSWDAMLRQFLLNTSVISPYFSHLRPSRMHEVATTQWGSTHTEALFLFSAHGSAFHQHQWLALWGNYQELMLRRKLLLTEVAEWSGQYRYKWAYGKQFAPDTWC